MSTQIACDQCGAPITDVAYELRVLFNKTTDPQQVEHYHWICLVAYMERQIPAPMPAAAEATK